MRGETGGESQLKMRRIKEFSETKQQVMASCKPVPSGGCTHRACNRGHQHSEQNGADRKEKQEV